MPNLGTLIIGLAAIALVACVPEESADVPQSGGGLTEREQLDLTVWANETEAQRFEQVFVRLWDSIREAGDKLVPLEELGVTKLSLGEPASVEQLDLGVRRTRFSDAVARQFDADGIRAVIRKLRASGYVIVETEWHHSQFFPAGAEPPRSVVSVVLHVRRNKVAGEGEEREERRIVRADLHVNWDASGAAMRPAEIAVRNLRIFERMANNPGFVQRLKISRGEHPLPTAHPLLLNDLDGDGLSEIILPRWNAVYRNGGMGKFTFEKLCVNDLALLEAAVVADFNGDSLPDVFSIEAEHGKPVLFEGIPGGKFAQAARSCAEVKMVHPSAIAAGDIDADGDLDLWLAQYKSPYNEGQMPTPYYDANDGYPSCLLINDGAGNFRDATEEAGLGARRLRRTYSGSFVDLDDDADLDLMVVSDFAGVDLYRNDGAGKFSDATADWIGPRHSFGMGHVIDDFNNDGRQDFYVIGMSSTTARRLDQMKLSRDDRPDIAEKRSEMSYGNRLYLGAASGRYEPPDFAARVARTGWSWGTTSFDFDNDGDRDIYVGNGHRSGVSTRDYCTKYWCHDVYTGSSEENVDVKNLLAQSMLDLNAGDISWNGYEKIALLCNLGGEDFANVAFFS